MVCSQKTIKGIPLSIYAAILCNLVVSSIAQTFVKPFLPRFVKYMGVSEVDAGYWVGIISSAITAGKFVTCLMWGLLADRLGRKDTLLIAGSGLLLTCIESGFCRAIWTVAGVQFLQGMSLGHRIMAKSIMSDHCDQNNLSFGMSFLKASSTLGTIIGPLVGALLVFPAQKYPSVFGEFFDKYVLLLPSVVLAALSLITLVTTLLCLPKDKPTNSNSNVKPFDMEKTFMKRFRIFEPMESNTFIVTCLLHMGLGIIGVGIKFTFPLFAATSRKYNGLALTETKIAMLTLFPQILTIFYQLTFLPVIINSVGTKKSFIGSVLVFGASQTLLPFTALIKNNQVLLDGAVILVYSLVRSAIVGASVTVDMFVNNSVDNRIVGSAHGVATMVSMLGKYYFLFTFFCLSSSSFLIFVFERIILNFSFHFVYLAHFWNMHFLCFGSIKKSFSDPF